MKQVISLFCLLLTSLLFAHPHTTRSFQKDVRTLRVCYHPDYSQQSMLARPYLTLSDDMLRDKQVLEISFDQLSHDAHSYTYTIKHLNADWTDDNLSSFEYLRGYTTADITDYEYSVLTQQLYTHYRFSFPNEDMMPLISGNYLLQIYEDGRTENIVAEVCFSIVEPQASVSAVVHSNTDLEISGRYQQLDIDVNTAQLDLLSSDELTLVVQQNGRCDNLVFAPRPNYVEPNRLRFLHNRALIFEGGNEYQHFDISSQYFMGENVDKIHFDHHYYYAYLFPSELRTWNYSYTPDANGRYIIHTESRASSSHTSTDYQDDLEADYMQVQWFLPVARPWLDGSVYILGDAFGATLGEDNRMTYDEEHGAYVFSAYLKQGGYEWQYGFYNSKSANYTTSQSMSKSSPYAGLAGASLQRIEGSYWQAHNTYRIFAYVRTRYDRYDRLVAIHDIEN